MKKVVLASLLAVAGAVTSASYTFAQAPAAGGGIQMSADEYAAYNNANTQAAGAPKVAAFEAYLKAYPNSAVKADVLNQIVFLDSRLGDEAATLNAADRLLAIDPTNIPSLTFKVYYGRADADKLTDPVAKQAALDAVAALAQKGLSAPKPKDTSDADFKALQAGSEPIFESAIADDYLVKKAVDAAKRDADLAKKAADLAKKDADVAKKDDAQAKIDDDQATKDDAQAKIDDAQATKDNAAAIAALKTEIDFAPDQTKTAGPVLQDVYVLAQTYYASTPPDLLNCAWYATRAAAFAPDAYKPIIQPLANYCYKKFHGAMDGYDAMQTSVQTNLDPPAGFLDGIKPAPKPADMVHALVASTSDLATLALGDKETALQYGSKEDADKVFDSVKGKSVEFPDVTVVSATADSLVLMVSDDANASKTPDFTVNLKEPLKTIPAVGDKITVDGTYASYTSTPLMITMSDGFVVPKKAPAKAAAKAPVHHTVHHN